MMTCPFCDGLGKEFYSYEHAGKTFICINPDCDNFAEEIEIIKTGGEYHDRTTDEL